MKVIEVEDLWKKFRIPREKRTTVLENIAAVLQILGGRRLAYEEFWALRGVNFSIEDGESLGVIGENGSGKSTLLKIIANVLRPDRGSVKVSGKIAPILELGVGFHPELTVKENALIYGSVMGLKNIEIDSRMRAILDFSGLERFKDAKLKNLSSGMQMRLAFSIAVETEPDIFLIDEALAVGDMEFKRKCLDKFEQLRSERKQIILVSHDMDLVKRFCKKTLFLSKGRQTCFGPTEEVVNRYAEGLSLGRLEQ